MSQPFFKSSTEVKAGSSEEGLDIDDMESEAMEDVVKLVEAEALGVEENLSFFDGGSYKMLDASGEYWEKGFLDFLQELFDAKRICSSYLYLGSITCS